MITHYPKDWIARASAHYVHACEKHPHFCDGVIPLWMSNPHMVKQILADCRNETEDEKSSGYVSAYTLLVCEIAEMCEAVANGDTASAEDEAYDCVAVLMRIVDTLRKQRENMEVKHA